MTTSVVMTTYNGSQYLNKQLDSIYMQTTKPHEVIIVDDASTDNSYELICEYIKCKNLSSWKVYRNEKNKGYIENFNYALQLSSGEILFTCDQDDEWNKEKIAVMLELMEKNQNIMLLSSALEFMDGKGHVLEKQYVPYGINNQKQAILTEIEFPRILEKNFFPGCTMAIRKTLVSSYISSDNKKLPHDWAMAMLAAADKGLFFLNKKLIKYRIHEGNTVGLDVAKESKIQYLFHTIKTWQTYCREFDERINYTDRNISLQPDDEWIYAHIKKFHLHRRNVVFHDKNNKTAKKTSILWRIKNYIYEICEYICYIRTWIDFRGICIDGVYVLKKAGE